MTVFLRTPATTKGENNMKIILNLQMFVAGPGTVVNATANMVNA